jgi:SAM-dependent methyltransferase
MGYLESAESAPPGSARFSASDVARLSATALNLLFGDDPAAPQVGDAACALAAEPDHLRVIAAALDPGVADALLSGAARSSPPGTRERAADRLVRGAFWHLLYELAPEIWDRISSREPIAPELLGDLPCRPADRVVEVAAGTGRLTASLEHRVAQLIAIEPSAPLRRLLRRRCPRAQVVAGVGHRMPVESASADVVISSATFEAPLPHEGEPVMREFERCVRPGGLVVLIAAGDPSWWEAQGYALSTYPEPEAVFGAELEAFVGPPIPPHLMLVKRIG